MIIPSNNEFYIFHRQFFSAALHLHLQKCMGINNIIFKESWFLPCLLKISTSHPSHNHHHLTKLQRLFHEQLLKLWTCYEYQIGNFCWTASERILPYRMCLVPYIFLESYMAIVDTLNCYHVRLAKARALIQIYLGHKCSVYYTIWSLKKLFSIN